MLGPPQRRKDAMAAYLVANITVHDPARFEEYRAAVPAVIARFGGRYLVRGGAVEAKEGEPGLNRLVILEFPDMAAARAFYDSADDAPLLAMRRAATTGSVALAEGAAA
jgi:uncharacterized protein (DUF1330 family)